MPTLSHSRAALAAALLAAGAARVAFAQIPESEFAARRDSLAKRIDSGVVIAFGGPTPITDFGTFHQLPAFHYLTNFDEPDAAFVMVVRHGAPSPTLFITAADPRMAFYYGW
ncbi:MAG TPA: aminopeptidase P N-terminal domain-containing protein, partial [Gemmatimonadaceae bacterium]|nr:aminopeptidase P N-terminal domain-containing protein [Gemmatimonadaceae bacterium]